MSASSSFDLNKDYTVVIYKGEGASLECAESTRSLLEQTLPVHLFQYYTSDMSTLFKNWGTMMSDRDPNKVILVIPGGHAMYYNPYSALPGNNNREIQLQIERFHKSGANIHATCAGALLISKLWRSEFHRFTPLDRPFELPEIKYTLAYLNSTAHVPVFFEKKKHTRGVDGARYTPVSLSDSEHLSPTLKGKNVKTMFVDSPGWNLPDTHCDEHVLGYYSDSLDKSTAAILFKNSGPGKIFAMGPHLEFAMGDLGKVETLTSEDQRLRRELFNHSFRLLGLNISTL